MERRLLNNREREADDLLKPRNIIIIVQDPLLNRAAEAIKVKNLYDLYDFMNSNRPRLNEYIDNHNRSVKSHFYDRIPVIELGNFDEEYINFMEKTLGFNLEKDAFGLSYYNKALEWIMIIIDGSIYPISEEVVLNWRNGKFFNN